MPHNRISYELTLYVPTMINSHLPVGYKKGCAKSSLPAPATSSSRFLLIVDIVRPTTCLLFLLHATCVSSFFIPKTAVFYKSKTLVAAGDADLDPDICSALTVKVCSSSACTRARRKFQLDEYHTLGALFSCAKSAGATPYMEFEESTCLGQCKQAPVVGVEHEDYVGCVSLEGMRDSEFAASVFMNVVDDDDIERVWSSVEGAVKTMMEAEDEE